MPPSARRPARAAAKTAAATASRRPAKAVKSTSPGTKPAAARRGASARSAKLARSGAGASARSPFPFLSLAGAGAAGPLPGNPAPPAGLEGDVFIQAGHERTPDGKTGGEGPLGREIDWTPVVADEATRLLRRAGVSVVREDASLKRPERRHERFRCAVAVFLHFDDPDTGESGASIGYGHESDRPAAVAWKALYAKFWPFGWQPDNFTADERDYYGYRYTLTTDAEFLIEFGDLGSLRQATWLKPRLRWLGALLAYFLSQRIGKGNLPLPTLPEAVADPHSEAPEDLAALHLPEAVGSRLPKRLPPYARDTLSAGAGVPWQKAGARPQFNAYKGLMPDSFYQFSPLQNMGSPSVSTAVFYESKFGIDSDGASGAGDPTHQGETSLRHADGRSLDARQDLYAVLPLDRAEARGSQKKLPGLPDFGALGLRLGDVGLAFWKDKMAAFVYADKGPSNAVGEGSIALAKALGINADPSVGGYNDKDIHDMGMGVVHVAFPGSGDWGGTGQPRTGRSAAQIKELALALWAAFRANGAA